MTTSHRSENLRAILGPTSKDMHSAPYLDPYTAVPIAIKKTNLPDIFPVLGF